MKDKSAGLSPFKETLYEAEVLQIAVKRAFQVPRPSSAVTRAVAGPKEIFLRSARVQSTGPRPIQKNAL